MEKGHNAAGEKRNCQETEKPFPGFATTTVLHGAQGSKALSLTVAAVPRKD